MGTRRRLASGAEWTANGLMTQRGDEIRVRSRSGRPVRVVARGRSPVYDPANATVLLLSHAGDLARPDGLHVWRLARGFRPDSWVQLLEHGVFDVTTGRRSVFLRGDGLDLRVTAPLGSRSRRWTAWSPCQAAAASSTS